jgi:L-aspartate oxidase
VDITTDPIPVAPAAHYLCGGVATNVDGRTSLRGLYACGEVACTGVHGANRLASNSLLESVVFAYRAAAQVDRYVRYLPLRWLKTCSEVLEGASKDMEGEQHKPACAREKAQALRLTLQELMDEHVAIVRSDRGLKVALAQVEELAHAIRLLRHEHRTTAELLETHNLITTARLVVKAALLRRRNVGVHFNIDLADPASLSQGPFTHLG